MGLALYSHGRAGESGVHESSYRCRPRPLGAGRSDVLRLVLGRGAVLTAVGIIVGTIGAAVLARVIESLLFETPPRDPLTYLTVCAVLAGVALLASYIPATLN
jgi:predicted lysophospholipase L1 biosynthesis ABC-type transport system permease subunit